MVMTKVLTGVMFATRLERLLPLLDEKGVGLINASPLSMGLLTKRGPPAWHPATDRQKAVCKQVNQQNGGDNIIKFLTKLYSLHKRVCGLTIMVPV
jgi:aryl-alcohol dehydrogenase-like predicted oxidoreductase